MGAEALPRDGRPRSSTKTKPTTFETLTAGEGRTRLTVIESRQGELPEGWMEIAEQLERWVIEELGGTYWSL